MPQALRLDPLMDDWTRRVEDTSVDKVGRLWADGRADGLSEPLMHLVLAVASARWVDHRGPFLGHGTFNGGPVLRAATVLEPEYRRLAWLTTAAYVVDVLRQPNYGPFEMLAMEPVDEPNRSDADATARFLEDARSNERPLLAEHRLVALLGRLGPAVRWPLMDLGIRQMAENEHRVLIVWRAVQLLDDVDGAGGGGWLRAEPLLRAAVQYLANRVDTRAADTLPPVSPIGRVEGTLDAVGARAICSELLEVPYGGEPAVVARAAQSASTRTLAAAIALAGSTALARSGFDAHAVTGLHCLLDVVHEPSVPKEVRTLAWLLALSGQRSRRQKAKQAEWVRVPSPNGRQAGLGQLRDALVEDRSGREAAELVATRLAAGGDARALARLLMEVALETSGPFDAIHNVKMVVGLLQEYERCPHPDGYMHLAAGAGAVARAVGEDGEGLGAVLAAWGKNPRHLPR